MTKRKKNQKSRSKSNNSNNNNNGGGGPSNHNNKRPRFDNGLDPTFDAPRGYIDPNTGQRGAFPGLEEDDGEFYGPANDGLEYLKMVRSEAKGVPSLLIAGQQYQQNEQKRQRLSSPTHQAPLLPTDELNYDDDNDAGNDVPPNHDDEPSSVPFEPDQHTSPASTEGEDSAGWYHDGTYTAAPLPIPSPTTPQLTPLVLWHTALTSRFLTLRKAFQVSPPPPSPSLVAGHLPIWRQRQYWQSHITNTKPTPSILSGMDQQTTLKVIEWLTPMLKSGKGAGRGSFVGVRVKGLWTEWVWGCLVRVDECLKAEEISVLRELGKRCLEVRGRLVKMREEWEEADEEAYGDEGNYGGYEEDEEEGVKVNEDQEDQEDQEEGECSEPEPVSTVPASSNIDSNPAEISLDLEEDNLPTTPTKTKPKPKAVELKGEEEDDAPIRVEPIPPSPPPNPTSKEKKEEHSYADTIGALDMVISIVGDFFRQKDLLLERELQGVAKVVGVLGS